MNIFRRSAAALMIAGAGLASTTGVALAHDGDSTVISDSGKALDTSGSNTLSGNAIACDIEAVQGVSVEDLAVAVPVEALNAKKNSPGVTETGQNTCSPESSNTSVSKSQNSAR